MNETVEPTVRKVETYLEGFFSILPKSRFGAPRLPAFPGVAWVSKWAVENMARRRDRGDLGVLLGSFVRWTVIVLGLLVGAAVQMSPDRNNSQHPAADPADGFASLHETRLVRDG